MGICASSQITRSGTTKWPPAAMIIDMDAHLQEFRQPIKAGHILSQNPNSFLCSSETMYVGSHALHVPYDEELQPGQIYFLMPLPTSKSRQTPLSLRDLCALAIKASTALSDSVMELPTTKMPPSSDKISVGFSGWTDGFDMAGMNSSVAAHDGRRIELYDKQS